MTLAVYHGRKTTTQQQQLIAIGLKDLIRIASVRTYNWKESMVVHLYAEIIHKFLWMDYRPYRLTNHALSFSMIPSVDLAFYGVSHLKIWVSGKCATIYLYWLMLRWAWSITEQSNSILLVSDVKQRLLGLKHTLQSHLLFTEIKSATVLLLKRINLSEKWLWHNKNTFLES